MAMHSTISSLFPHYPLPSSPTAKPKLVSSSSMYFDLKRRHISRNTVMFRALAAAEALAAEAPSSIAFDDELGLAPIEKPSLALKFIWMEKNIGLALDQLIPGYGAVPLSPYFFWPRKDAWEELKTTLESKPWISQKKMIIILNQATDIINLWQQSGGNFTSSSS